MTVRPSDIFKYADSNRNCIVVSIDAHGWATLYIEDGSHGVVFTALTVDRIASWPKVG